MSMLFTIIRYVLSVLPVFLLCLLLIRVNLPKDLRVKQFLMPFIAIAYSIVMLLLLPKISALLQKLIELLISAIDIAFLQNLLSQALNGSGLFFLFNYVFLLVFILIKRFVIKILAKRWGNRDIVVQITSGHFYERDPKLGVWLLREKWRDLSRYFFYLYIVAFVLLCVLVAVMKTMLGNGAAFYGTLYPVAAIIILGEIAFYLGGETREEYVRDILGDNENALRVYNYSGLRGVLKNIFGDRILYDRYGDHSENDLSTFGEIDELMESPDRDIRNTGNYFYKLKMQGKQVDLHYVRSCMDLCAGKSVLINNPFYRDLTDYLVFVMMRQLLAHKKILIIAGRDAMENDLKDWIDEGFYEHMNLNGFWNTQVLQEETEDWDVGILQFSHIHDLKLQMRQAGALAKVGFVLFIEPSRILATAQIGLSLLLERCEQDGAPVYCACDRNSDGVVDALSHLLKVSITEVSASTALYGRLSEICWKADGPYMHHEILPDISRYLGVGSEIAAAAVRMQVSKTMWLSNEKFPVSDMKWILGQYYQSVCKYAGIPVGQEKLYERIGFRTNIWQCDPARTNFLIVEDEFCNLYEMVRLFGTRSMEEGVVNVLSEEYLMRDYMLAHARVFQADPKAVPSVVPDYAGTEKNVLLRLLLMMSEEPVSEARIIRELRLTGVETEDVYHMLQVLFAKYCSEEKLALKMVWRDELSEDRLRTVSRKYFLLGSSKTVQEYMERLKTAYYVMEDEEGRRHYIGARLYGHVFQILLPGQFFTYAGKYYEVVRIAAESGVIVRRAADHIAHRLYYRQKQTVVLQAFKPEEKMGSDRSISEIRVTQGCAQVQILTHGYYRMTSNDDIARASYVHMNGIPVRGYLNKSVLRLDLPGASDAVKRTVCIVLNELFRTIYPDTWPYIHVTCAAAAGGEDTWSGLAALLPALDTDQPDDGIYFIEDSDIDMGLLVSIERNIRRYLEFVTEYLTWHEDMMQEEPPKEEQEEEAEITFDDMSGLTIFERFKEGWRRRFGKQIVPGEAGAGTGRTPDVKPSGRDTGSETADEEAKAQTDEKAQTDTQDGGGGAA